MKYIITERQYRLIDESLGVPVNIHEAAIELYDLFLEDLKSIDQKEEEYEFSGHVDILLGDKKKIEINEYVLKVEIQEEEDYGGLPLMRSMGMGQRFKFDRDIMMKEIEPSTKAEFSLEYIVSPNWEPSQLVENFEDHKEDYISSLSHELKHKYDKQVKRIDLIGPDAEYLAIQEMPRLGINILDNKFRRFLYYTDVAENLVRTTEVASNMKLKNITKDQFREFLEKNNTFKTLVEIKNFTYENFIKGLYNSIDRIDEFLDFIDIKSDGMTDEQKVNMVLRFYYIRLANMKYDTFKQYITAPMDGLFELFGAFGSKPNPNNLKIDNLQNKFYNYISKYKDNPNQFYIDEIKKFHYVSDQMIKKLSKLYAMASEPSQQNESILNWELYVMTKKTNFGTKRQFTMIEGLHDTSWENDEGDKISLVDLLFATENIPVQDLPIKWIKPHLLSWDGDEEEVKKIESADLKYPILILVDDDGKFISIIDGHHRAQKAVRKGKDTIKGKLIKINSLPKKIRKVFSHL